MIIILIFTRFEYLKFEIKWLGCPEIGDSWEWL